MKAYNIQIVIILIATVVHRSVLEISRVKARDLLAKRIHHICLATRQHHLIAGLDVVPLLQLKV